MPDIGARTTRLAMLMSPILRGEHARPVTDVSFSGGNIAATAYACFQHKSCAVKFHAYTLDNSRHLASALQQNLLPAVAAGTRSVFTPGA
jgi:hypothetical protein